VEGGREGEGEEEAESGVDEDVEGLPWPLIVTALLFLRKRSPHLNDQ